MGIHGEPKNNENGKMLKDVYPRIINSSFNQNKQQSANHLFVAIKCFEEESRVVFIRKTGTNIHLLRKFPLHSEIYTMGSFSLYIVLLQHIKFIQKFQCEKAVELNFSLKCFGRRENEMKINRCRQNFVKLLSSD